MLRRWFWFLRALRARMVLLGICLALAAAGPVAVATLSAGISDGSAAESARLAGGPLAITANRPFSATEAAAVTRLTDGRPTARSAELITIARTPIPSGTPARLTVRLVAVDDAFPLRGQWRGDDATALHSASPAVLVQASLLRRTGAVVGDTLRLGRVDARIAGIVVDGPQVGGGFSLGPTVLIGYRHLEDTGLAGFGSRVTTSVWIDAPRPETLRRELQRQLGLEETDRAEGPFSAGQQLKVRTAQALVAGDRRLQDQLTTMLGLAAALGCAVGAAGAVVLGRLAGLSAIPDLRLLRTLGATPLQAAGAALGAFLGTGVLAGLLGATVGLIVAVIAGHSLGQEISALPWEPLLTVLLLTALLPPAAALGPVHSACAGAPAAGLRTPALWPVALVGAGFAVALSGVVGQGAGLVAISTLLAGIALAPPLALLVRLLARIGRRLPLAGIWGALGWALRGCGRPGSEALLTGLGLALVASGVAAVLCLRSSMLGEIQPENNGPGTFLIDVQPDQVDAIAALAEAESINATLRPIVVGRLLSTRKDGEDSEDARFFRRREQRLSWRDQPEDGDRTVAGRWIQGPGEASLEQRWAARLGVGLGDQLTFSLNDATVAATVVGLRAVRWTSFRPNFFVYLHRDDLQAGDATWIAALPAMPAATQDRLLDRIRQTAPNVSAIDVADGVRTALELADALAAALAWVAAAAVGAALAVVGGLALATRPRREDEISTARSLGAPPALVPTAHRWEAFLLGSAGGLLGTGTGLATAWLLVLQAEWTLSIPWSLLWLPPLAGLLTALVTGLLNRGGRP